MQIGSIEMASPKTRRPPVEERLTAEPKTYADVVDHPGLEGREKKLAYDRQWRANNRSQCIEANRRYREKKRDPGVKPQYRIKIGERYGRLLVLDRAPGKRGLRVFLCACGREHVARGSHVHAGLIISCGCFRSDYAGQHNLTHGHASGGASAEYRTWQNIVSRCEKPTNIVFHRYGAAGISVCDRWRNSFPNFLADMGMRPSSKHSIDRYPNQTGNYEPDNCRWATATQQVRNRRNTIFIELLGERIPLIEACERHSVKYKSAYAMLRGGRSARQIFWRAFHAV